MLILMIPIEEMAEKHEAKQILELARESVVELRSLACD